MWQWQAFEYLIYNIVKHKNLYIERTANVFMFLSAILLSTSPALSIKAWPFLGFLIGHVIWITVGMKMKKRTLIEYNAGFLLLDIWAISVRL